MMGTRVVTFLVITYLTGIQGQAETTTEAQIILGCRRDFTERFISTNFSLGLLCNLRYGNGVFAPFANGSLLIPHLQMEFYYYSRLS